MQFEIITALLTPIVDSKIDYYSLDKIIDIQLQANITQLVALGSTAETHTLSPLERWKLLAHIRKATNGRCTIKVAVGNGNTTTTVKDAIKAKEYGADSLLVVTPYYGGYTEQGLIEHYRQVHSATQLPITLYNVPSRTAQCILPSQVAQLHKLGYIHSIKECTNNIKLARQISAIDRALPIYCGNDHLIPNYNNIKCAGAVSVLSNIAPKFVTQCATNKQYSKILQQLTASMSYYPNPIPIKYIAHQLGIINSDSVRLPLTTIPSSDKLLHNTYCKYRKLLV